ncbi:terminase small subunit [Mucilaginibacter segetis]|uniref:Uncharacterized protein n=1 Tax=Mucilaginibacter segetis TaxID=2793071 RepID=A0A934UM71_9SPHI|nr:terminase small subunit [Mucilaginibacter segetis]MBK0378591.1 hypothetical protein [Mucilaginibacter segetis]
MQSLTNAEEYTARVNEYFTYLKGEYHLEQPAGLKAGNDAPTPVKVWDREPEPALLSNLALWLGFNSRQEFETYERNGEFATVVKRARLRIEAEYEKKLHYQSATGAIFALKSMGWTDRADNNTPAEEVPKSLPVEIINLGPSLAASEGEVEM